MRAWPIDTGRRVTNGNRMKRRHPQRDLLTCWSRTVRLSVPARAAPPRAARGGDGPVDVAVVHLGRAQVGSPMLTNRKVMQSR